MKHQYLYVILLASAAFFSSCGTMRPIKSANFVSLSETNKIDGDYFLWTREQSDYADRISRKNALSFFERDTTDYSYMSIQGRTRAFTKDTAEFMHLRTEGKDKLIVSYQNKTGKYERVYKGQLKKKFFEIYYNKKQFYMPLIFSYININRVRVGKSEKGELIINNFADQTSNLLMLAGGWYEHKSYKFHSANINKELIPVRVDGKWGYADSQDNIVIPCQYDYACFFESGIAQVRLNDKWGIIDQRNRFKIPCIYSLIVPFADGRFKVYLNNKSGVLDGDGKEVIPVIYDHIGPLEDNMAKIKLGDKIGYITRDEVVIPAIYTHLYEDGDTYFFAEKNGGNYFVDRDGYEYQLSEKSLRFKKGMVPDTATKRKILFEEQDIEQ
ncbi:hypothetical protein M2451_000928 [Dysgonomonas sp. PFB1-18]|uniref:WG repeat-containing protein n=1 Tax=unclassified Dysgonomonas TaxID=2630389 RepID=UPI0024742DBB|nr:MULTISPECIES: WG repeat-containing protein [unclassified Dysgonomonas]MDH6308617.1 hypothetical protein [Dysgonomonas sp. PF1-14]MDH6338118.1 hypothetical protein [Dysgonomonas sp. PF1-16]MDH6379615.1 hypothetical protein [Dysgonomonas sp. PFB1-18]MDH6396945.1 hypothetical protein [Dysgonomonas sp. PF1-23]